MAKDDEDWKERQERRKEEDADERERNKKLGKVSRNEKDDLKESLAGATTEKLTELIERAESSVDRLNTAYNQFFAGVEKRPPIEQRKQLDQTMYTLQLISKPTAAYQFRYTTVVAKYNSYTQRWDKKLKEIEDGKQRLRIADTGKKKIGSF